MNAAPLKICAEMSIWPSISQHPQHCKRGELTFTKGLLRSSQCVSNFRLSFKSQHHPIRYMGIFLFPAWRNQNTQRKYLTSQSCIANQKRSETQNPRIPSLKAQVFRNIHGGLQKRSLPGMCFITEVAPSFT